MKKISVITALIFSCSIGLTGNSWAQLLTDGLIGYYKLNGNADDSSSNHVNGVPVGGLTPTSDRFGNPSGALSFNGIDQTIAAPNEAFPRATNSFTFSLWAKPNGPEPIEPETVSGTSYSHSYLIFGIQGGSNSGINIAVGTNGISVLEHGDAFLPVVLSYATSITNWTMIAVTYSNNGAPNLYINGNYVHTGLDSGRIKIASVFAGDGYQGIGGGGYGRYKGSANDVMLYDRALTPAELTELYNAQAVPEPSTYALLLLSGAASLWALKRRKS